MWGHWRGSRLWPLVVWMACIIPSTNGAVCYVCDGQSSTSGQYCSLGNLCAGPSCYFDVDDSGTWQAGCGTLSADSTNVTCAYDSPTTSCTCSGDFCNKLQPTLVYLSTFWAENVPGKTITPVLPSDDAVPCFECGQVQVNGTVITLACDQNHLCDGGYCMTVTGQYPYSLCATSWEGSADVRCLMTKNQQQKCVCAGQMCNFPYDPDKIPTTTTAGSVTNSSDCPEGNRWNPNQQAVYMGNKLKDIIMNGFGSGTKALQNFQSGINTHICGYSEPQK
ncbi:unnamed protein product, partial [Mesorhabditis spiculigera]